MNRLVLSLLVENNPGVLSREWLVYLVVVVMELKV